jgi:hypothetical protein
MSVANPADQSFASPQSPAARTGKKARRKMHDGWVYLILALLTAGAWWISSLRLFTAGSEFGYWLGVAGGVTMLGVFAYPMRKHFRFMQRWGAGKYWFVVHMCVGIVGPLLILVHSTFMVGSINAGIALFSMVIVALSGVAGRFLYVRVHRDLQGDKLSLGEMRKHITGDESALAKLRFAPEVQAALQYFEEYALAHEGKVLNVMLHAAALSFRRWRTERRCHEILRVRLLALVKTEGWSQRDFRRRLRTSRALTSDFLRTAQRIAEFSAWDKLFSLWHVVHVPFVYMMVLSAVAHVVAVHAY